MYTYTLHTNEMLNMHIDIYIIIIITQFHYHFIDYVMP